MMLPGDAPADKAVGANFTTWRVVSVAGSARYRWNKPLEGWSQVTQGVVLLPFGQLETGRGGRVVLSNGHDWVTLSPNSRMQLPAPSSDKTVTVILQDAGNIHFDVESRRNQPATPASYLGKVGEAMLATRRARGRFEVHTPFLVAGVKGTRFDVSVSTQGATVSVSEGVVGVSNRDGGSSVDVNAGQTASTSSATGNSVSLSTTTSTARPPQPLDQVEEPEIADPNAQSASTEGISGDQGGDGGGDQGGN